MPEKARPSYARVIASLAAPAFLFGIFAVLSFSSVGLLLSPFAAAFLALLFVFENPKKRFLSYLVPAAWIIAEVAAVLFRLSPFLSASPVMILPALLSAFLFHRKWIRRDGSLLLIFSASILFFISLYLLVANLAGSFSFGAVMTYYKSWSDTVGEQIAASLSSSASLYQERFGVLLYSEGDLAAIRQTVSAALCNNVVSAVVIAAAVFTCFLNRTFSFRVKKITGIGRHPMFADFLLSTASAVLFFLLFFVYIFGTLFGGEGAVWMIVVSNALNIYTCLFAYIGWRGLRSAFRNMKRPGLIFAVLIAVLLFTTSALRVLAFFGAYANIMFNRAIRRSDFPDDPDQNL